jgi:hypothetical protein
LQVNEILAKHGFNAWVIAYVEMKGVIFQPWLKLWLLLFYVKGRVWHNHLWGHIRHVMSECCQYVTNDSTVCVYLTIISIKEAQYVLQKTIAWTKKSGKGQHEWHKTCLHSGVPPRKLKTQIKTMFASKVILFQETLKFKHTIV